VKIMQTIYAFDVSLFIWVMRRKSQKFLVQGARYVSKTGDGHGYLLLALLLAWSHAPTDWLLLKCLAMGLAMERSAYFIIKNLCKRDRPPVALNIPSFISPADRFSFPSGHTSAAFLMASVLSYFYPALMPFAFVWAVLVGMARVILGVHFPTDTLIGALMGSVVASLAIRMLLP